MLASHSHFVMNDAYNTACHKDDVLPGWIMGSAGAVRYRLPADRALSTIDKTDIYAYLLGTVAAGWDDHASRCEEIHEDPTFRRAW